MTSEPGTDRDERFRSVRREARKIFELFISEHAAVRAVDNGDIIELYKSNSYRYYWMWDGEQYRCRFYDRHSREWKTRTNPNPYPIVSDLDDGYSWEVVPIEESPFESTGQSDTGIDRGDGR